MASLALASILAVLAALHFFWLLGGRWGQRGAIPSVDGNPIFEAPRWATASVAAALLAAAFLALWRAGWIETPRFLWVPRVGIWGVAALFALRAIGDFRWVGFFKRARESQFARLDTRVYSPLCAGISGLASWVGYSS